jgi:transcriptional regulator with XRE-family HTH domain
MPEDIGMDPKQILAQNVKLLKAYSGLANLKLAKKCGVSEGTINRAQKASVALDIDSIEAIASAFGLHAWQLLVPNLDPRNPHMVAELTTAERDLYRKLSAAINNPINR